MIFVSDDDVNLRLCMAKADRKSNQFTILIAKYVIGGFVCMLAIMATLNIIFSLVVYGGIKEEVLYIPYRFV